MIQLIANMIVITALGGAAIIVALAVVKVVLAFAAAVRSSKPDAHVVLEKTCAYCGHMLGEETQCEYCGAVRQREQDPT